MICSPGFGTRLKLPNRVQRMLMFAQSAPAAAKLGRSLYWRSRLVSRPVVILNGGPEFATINGLNTSLHQGALIVPTKVNRCRTSPEPRPNSPVKSYEFTGKPPPPSVSLFILLQMKVHCSEIRGFNRIFNPV